MTEQQWSQWAPAGGAPSYKLSSVTEQTVAVIVAKRGHVVIIPLMMQHIVTMECYTVQCVPQVLAAVLSADQELYIEVTCFTMVTQQPRTKLSQDFGAATNSTTKTFTSDSL